MADKEKNNSNTRDSENLLFKRLTRLLSGPLVNYRTQQGRRLRRIDIDQFASRFKSASGRNFKKMAYDPFSNIQANVMAAQQRLERYVDFDQMEYTPEIASSLDIYADEMTTHSRIQPLMTIECQNEEIKAILESLYFQILNVEFNLFGWCRTMAKYGDMFLYLDIDESRGVQNIIGLPAAEVERLEGEDKTNPNYIQYQWNSGGLTFENWQIAHFRILGNDKYAPYGTSILEPARRIWRQLTLLEDAMMAYRIVRSPERRVFKIDVGNIPPQDVEQYIQKVMTQMKRHQVVDPDTGRVDLRYNPLSVDEDYFIPVRGQSQTEITTLAGGAYTGDIDDVKYLRDKLFSALKIPQSYLSRGEEGGEGDATLAQKDIRFARTIQRLQRSVVTELEKIGIVHLYVLGYRDEDLVSFKLNLSNPSKLAELQELEHWKAKFEAAGAATEGYFSKRWVSKHMFGMTDEEILKMQRELYYDRKFEASLETAAEAEQAAATGGGDADMGGGDAGGFDELGGGDEGGEFGGGMGGDALGGEDAGGMGDAMAEAPPEEPGDEAEPAAEPEEAGDLLAEPGKRDDKKTRVHAGPHGTKKYRPVPFDKRQSAGRAKSYKGAWSNEKATATFRNVLPGASQILALRNLGLSESLRTSYSRTEEDKILSLGKEIEDLIEGLNKRDKDEA
jgi:hypothetical protein